MKIFHNLILLLLIISSCQPKQEDKKLTNKANSSSLDSLFQRYHEEVLKFNPLEATYAGDDRYNDTLPNFISESYREALRNFYASYKDQLLEYDKSELSETDDISYEILLWECNTALESLQFPTHLDPLNQMWTLQLTMGQLASGTSAQPFKTVQDYKNWIKRVKDFGQWCDTAVVNMQKGISSGWVLPKPLSEKVVPQLAGFAEGPVEDHLFYAPARSFPDSFSDAEKDSLKSAYKAMVEEIVIPKFKMLLEFFVKEYVPNSRETHGALALPNGKAYYDFRIKQFTTTDMTADEIFELGKREVARLLGEMEKVKKQVGFEGNMKEFFNHVRSNDELMPFDSADQVIENFNTIYERMKPELDNLFDITPKTAFEVRRTESFREASAAAQYNPGSLDGSRPGIFYVPIPNVTAYNTFSDESLFLHEAIPGHHYQISLQQENEYLPKFRRTLWYSAYGEGWALYSESLGKELGLYTDPYQYFGMLSAEMHRAIRLVVDAGIHAKGWTREEAIQYSLENEAESEASIISEIERYMALPGQALSYKIGQLKILELRASAEKELGDKFDIKVFHNKILESGCLPLEVLEQKISRWIISEKTPNDM